LLTPVTPLKKSKILVSVLIPVYNEVDTVAEIVERVRSTPHSLEIICVDDASTDGTRDILQALASALGLLGVSAPESMERVDADE